MSRTCYISRGHNGARAYLLGPKDWWANHNGETEFKYVDKVACQLAKMAIPGLNLVLVPTDLGITARAKWINARCKDGDVVIELHMDSGPTSAEGCTTFFHAGSSYAENKAKEFQMEYTRVTGLKGRGVKPDTATRHGRLGIVRETKPLALLLEMGFLTNEKPNGYDCDRDAVWVRAADWIAWWLKKAFA